MMKKTFKVAIAACLCATMAAAGCKPAAQDTEKAKDYIGTETIGQSQVKVYGNGETGDYKSVAFEETNALCADNEGMGWVVLEEPLLGGLPSLGYKGTLPEVKCVSLSTAWSTVEKTPGVYD